MTGAGPAPWRGEALQLPAWLSAQVVSDKRRIVIVGAGGWIGKTALMLLYNALGQEAAAARILCFGSSSRTIEIAPSVTFEQRPLSALDALECRPTLLLHLAFLTMDKIQEMEKAEYIRRNRALSEVVHDALDLIGVDRLFVASSGAAAFAEDAQAAPALRLYGQLKVEDEKRFATWATRDPARLRVAIARIYSVSGPFINKHETYALASFILAVLSDRLAEVTSPIPIYRSYVALRELLALVFAILLGSDALSEMRFDTGGVPLELGEVAQVVAATLGGSHRRNDLGKEGVNRYVGDHDNWRLLLARYGLEHLPLSDQIAETANYLQAIGATQGPR